MLALFSVGGARGGASQTHVESSTEAVLVLGAGMDSGRSATGQANITVRATYTKYEIDPTTLCIKILIGDSGEQRHTSSIFCDRVDGFSPKQPASQL